MNIPFEVFFGFIGVSAFLFVLGLVRQPTIPASVMACGMFILFIAVFTDNIIMNQLPFTHTAIQVLSNTTVYDVSQYYTVSNSYTGNNPFQGEFFNGSSTAIGKSFSCMTIPLKKVGNPTGVIYFGILDTTNKGTMKKIIGSMDISALTTGFKPVTQCAGSVGLNTAFQGSGFDKYTIISGDKVGIFYNDGNATNYLVSGNSRYKDFDTVQDPTCTTHNYSIKVSLPDVNAPPFFNWGGCDDMTMQLINTNSQTITTDTYTSNLFPMNNYVKVFIAFMGVMIMLISGLMLRSED